MIPLKLENAAALFFAIVNQHVICKRAFSHSLFEVIILMSEQKVKSSSSSSSLESSSSEDRSRGVPLRKPEPKKQEKKYSSSSDSRSDSVSSDDAVVDRNRRKEPVEEATKKRQKASASSHSDEEERHEFKVRKIQAQQDDDAAERPTQFNAKNWTRERKPGALFRRYFTSPLVFFYSILFDMSYSLNPFSFFRAGSGGVEAEEGWLAEAQRDGCQGTRKADVWHFFEYSCCFVN
jgi:hypothetical protein